MATATTYQPQTLEAVLARPCGCGALAWACVPPFGRVECLECGAAFSRPCGLPAPAGPGEGDAGDDDGPESGPAAPALDPAGAQLALAVSAARAARPFTHLSELSPAEQAEYLRWAAEVLVEVPDVAPCAICNRPASPYEDTPAGPVCWRCWAPAPSPALTLALAAVS